MPGILTDTTIKISSAAAQDSGIITSDMRDRMVDGRVSTFDLQLATDMANGNLGGGFKAELLGAPLKAAIEDKLGSQSSLDSFIEAAKDIFPVLVERYLK